MATNKRKDAAALFELIEKSTLKVPKGGSGSLKIPSWWSSKVNPPTEPTHPQENNTQAQSAPAAPAPKFPEPLTPDVDPFEKLRSEHAARPVPNDPTVKPPKETLPVDLPPTPQNEIKEGQNELNWDELPLPAPDDPDPEVAAEATPDSAKTESKPAVPPVASSVPSSTYGHSNHGTSAGHGHVSHSASVRAPSSAYRPPVAVPPTTRMAAPSYTSSYAASRAGQKQNFVIMMLESPLWVKASFYMAIIALIFLIVALLTPSKTQKPSAPPLASANNNVTQSLDKSPMPSVIPDPPAPTRTGRFVPANTVQRKSDKFYLVIWSVRSQNIANDIAKFAAENGVDDVTVERHQDRGGDGRIYNNFKIISVEGVSKLDREAEAMRMRIVEVGRKHPESKSFHKGIFDDAYFAKVTRGK